MAQLTTVPVKPPVASKINWTAIISSVAMIGAYFGLNFDAAQIAALVTTVGVGSQVLQFVLRTWFTKSVVSNSL